MAVQPLLPFGVGDACAVADSPPAPPVPSVLSVPSAPSSSGVSRLIEELGRICAELPLEEKILVAPSLAIGHQTVERLALAGHRPVHLRVETVRNLAHAAVGPALAVEGKKLLSRAQALALIEQACAETLDDRSYFGELGDRPGFHRALQSAFDELRAAGLSPAALPAGAFADPRKPRELSSILERYQKALDAGGWIDRAEVLRRAVELVEAGPPPSRDGRGAVYLLPDGEDLKAVERRFLERLAGAGLRTVPTDPPEAWTQNAAGARIFRAIGEENEIREAFRGLLAGGARLDEAELLHTDSATYPALVFELASEHSIPCTFSGGVAASYTQPGRAALAFLQWVGEGFEAEALRQALASRHIAFPRDMAGHGASPLDAARAIREAAIGWGRRRHETALDRLVAELERPDDARPEEGEEGRAERDRRRIRRLARARAAREFVGKALALAPAAEKVGLAELARGVRGFVAAFTRVTGDLDATAASALDKLFEEFEALASPAIAIRDAALRLADAVRALHVATDRPRPGRLHVAELGAGGYSGRRRTFVIGLDETRHPGAELEDPVLSDEERRRINEAVSIELPLGRERAKEKSRALRACLARLRGNVALGWSGWNVRNLAQPGDVFPSPFLLEAFRQRAGEATANYERLGQALEAPAGFVPGPGGALDETEWWLARIENGGARGGPAAATVRALHPWLADGRRATEAREGLEFTAWDGDVGTSAVPLDPRESRAAFSSSRIQTLARCPHSYFLKVVLGVEAPEEIERDATEWLDAMKAGTLVHAIFHAFLQELAASGRKPDLVRDLPRIEAIADREILAWREKVPPRSELAFQNRRKNVFFACRTFLLLEEAHCREVTPRWFETAFGLPREASAGLGSRDPVEIPLGPGGSFLLRGSIDRIDEGPAGDFHVWDYKTGGALGVKEEKGLHGGRQIQHAIYALALEALLARSGRSGAVSRSGYFFPGRKGQGQRFAIPLSTPGTQDVLNTLFDLLRGGQFPHTQDPNDCRFCEFTGVCGEARIITGQSRAKLGETGDSALAAYRDIDGR